MVIHGRRGSRNLSTGETERVQPSGYGSAAASPPVTVLHSPLAQFGQGGRLCVELTSIVLPQLVQRYVPAETSLPAGPGSAIGSSWLGRDSTGQPLAQQVLALLAALAA